MAERVHNPASIESMTHSFLAGVGSKRTPAADILLRVELECKCRKRGRATSAAAVGGSRLCGRTGLRLDSILSGRVGALVCCRRAGGGRESPAALTPSFCLFVAHVFALYHVDHFLRDVGRVVGDTFQ